MRSAAAIALSGLDRDRLAFEEGHDLGLRAAVDDDVDLMLERCDHFLDVRLALRGADVDGDAAIGEGRSILRERSLCAEQDCSSRKHEPAPVEICHVMPPNSGSQSRMLS